MEFNFRSELWEWSGQGAWCFISLPSDYYEIIRSLDTGTKRGFGSVRVGATIGKTTWKTSVFPDTKSKSYLLPVKKEVRKSESLEIGSQASVKIKILEVI